MLLSQPRELESRVSVTVKVMVGRRPQKDENTSTTEEETLGEGSFRSHADLWLQTQAHSQQNRNMSYAVYKYTHHSICV